jgi:hypothetical protein
MKIYAPNTTERVKYAIDLVLKQVCLFDYEYVSKEEIKASDIVVNYSGEHIESCFQVHPHGLLFEDDIKKFDVTFEYGGKEKVKLFTTEFDDLGFDIFSASFFLATRFEEYWKFEPDNHDRYTSKSSLASKLGYLHLPLINIWAEVLKEKLKSRFPGLKIKYPSFKVINTIDIDNAWAYLNKGALRASGALAKAGAQLKLSEMGDRAKVLSSGKNDPYDTYDYLKKVQDDKGIKSIYFFLLGDRGEFDKNVPHTSKELQRMINQVSTYATIGIHPSYGSYLNPKQLEKEIGRLNLITDNEVSLSRKHFLKLSIPETYRNLEKAGITNDYSMGYADNIGFRASICTPYTFFDVLQNKDLNIKVHPFAYMDGTLNEYLGLSIADAKEKVASLKQQVKEVGGVFIGIWHNETVNDKGIWKGWREVYEMGLDS